MSPQLYERESLFVDVFLSHKVRYLLCVVIIDCEQRVQKVEWDRYPTVIEEVTCDNLISTRFSLQLLNLTHFRFNIKKVTEHLLLF